MLGHVPQVDLQTGLARFAAWVLPEDQLEKAKAELVTKGMME